MNSNNGNSSNNEGSTNEQKAARIRNYKRALERYGEKMKMLQDAGLAGEDNLETRWPLFKKGVEDSIAYLEKGGHYQRDEMDKLFPIDPTFYMDLESACEKVPKNGGYRRSGKKTRNMRKSKGKSMRRRA
jgi:hypothetical protein